MLNRQLQCIVQSYIGGGHIAFGADPVVVPIPDHMASLLFYRSFIGMVAMIATRQPNRQISKVFYYWTM